MPMSVQQAAAHLKQKAQQLRQMPEMDLSREALDKPNMPELDLSGDKPEPRPGFDAALATAGDVPDDVVQMVGEPVVKAPQVAKGESQGLGSILRSTEASIRAPLARKEAGQSSPLPLAAATQGGSLDEAIQATRRLRGLVGVGEVIDAQNSKPQNFSDFVIAKAGGHPIERGFDKSSWAGAEQAAEAPMQDYAQRMKAASDALAKQRQASTDALNARKGESEIKKNIAEAGKADREPVEHPGAPKPDPKAYKQSMKADPLLLQQFHGDQKKLNAWVDSQADDEKALSDSASGIRGQSKGLAVMYAGKAQDLADAPKKEANQVAGAVTKDVVKERKNIATARGQLQDTLAAFHAIPAEDIAKAKAGYETPAFKAFKASALAVIDKTGQVETGGAARQAAINQWKAVLEDGQFTNAQMDAAIGALGQAMDRADQENEGSLEGLPDVGGRKAAPKLGPGNTVRMKFPSGTVHQVPAEDVEEAKREHGAVEVSGG